MTVDFYCTTSERLSQGISHFLLDSEKIWQKPKYSGFSSFFLDYSTISLVFCFSGDTFNCWLLSLLRQSNFNNFALLKVCIFQEDLLKTILEDVLKRYSVKEYTKFEVNTKAVWFLCGLATCCLLYWGYSNFPLRGTLKISSNSRAAPVLGTYGQSKRKERCFCLIHVRQTESWETP